MVFKLKFTLYEPGSAPRTITSDIIPDEKIVVGRGQNVQLWINDKNISREHCQLSYEDGQIMIDDLKSRNGTFVNGQRILKKMPLSNGDQIRLASTSHVTVAFQPKESEESNVSPPETNAPPVNNPISQQATIKIPVDRPDASVSHPIILPRGESSLIGHEFNGYRIESKIGTGGMAIVYKGIHLALNRPVAIKTLTPRLTENSNAVKRFLNVAKVAGQLTHPNIVQIYDSGTLDQYGIYYIIMEYVEGESLNNILQEQTKLPLDRACKIVGYIANALTYANKKNIIHRDINPSNILVGKEDVPKLIGLGLAKCLDDELMALTQPGKGMGMVGYISPEQLMDASKADHKSDIYSLGAVFYHCLCGKTPYDTKNMREYFNCIHNHIPPIPPCELTSEIPKPINDIILQTLAFEPRDRYNTADDFLLALKSHIAPRVDKDGIERARKQIMAMLPQRTSVPGLEFESIYKPAEGIGGDFYDFIELNDREIGVVIADVTGHGVEAAVVVGMVKAALKIIGRQVFDTAEVLRRANQEIYPDLDTTTFATIFYGIIDRESKMLRFSRAGHNPLILYNPNRENEIETYEPKGMVLGMFSRCECEEEKLQLESGDYLIQYTDGVTEAMNSNQEEFGMNRLLETIRVAGKQGDIKKILTSIEDAVYNFSGAVQQHDDITLIGIKIQ